MADGRLSVAGREALMGTKDKGGRSSKKAPARSLKEKRLDKKRRHLIRMLRNFVTTETRKYVPFGSK